MPEALPSFSQSLFHLANSYTFPPPSSDLQIPAGGPPWDVPLAQEGSRGRQSNWGGAVCLSDQGLPDPGAGSQRWARPQSSVSYHGGPGANLRPGWGGHWA